MFYLDCIQSLFFWYSCQYPFSLTMIIKYNQLLYTYQPLLPLPPSPLSERASLPPEFTHTMGFLLWLSEEKGGMSTSMIVLSPKSCKLGHTPLGMSAKPSRRLTCHWMGLSSSDNWLSISGRDNRVRVGGKGVNHYLSVRLSQLLCCCLYPPSLPPISTVSLFLSCTRFTPSCILLFYRLLFCLMSVSLMVFTVRLAFSCFPSQPRCRVIPPVQSKATELKVLQRQQLTVAT